MSYFDNSNESFKCNEKEFNESLNTNSIFFRNGEANSPTDNDFQKVLNFEICDLKYFKKEKEINDLMKNNECLFSTVASKKSESKLWAGNSIQNSKAEVLFSGYFGPSEEDKNIDQNTGFFRSTNPFPRIEDDRSIKRREEGSKNYSKLERSSSKIGFKKPKSGDENFNGSFLADFRTVKVADASDQIFMNASSNSISSASFNDLVKNVSLSTMNKNKKRILSSEERLLEKIKKEKEEMNRLRMINIQNAEKTKQVVTKPVNLCSLTLLKPFNLSSNHSKMLLKKRGSNINIEEINHKITETMKKKCEGSIFGNDLIKMQKTPPNIKYMKRNTDRSKSPRSNYHSEDMQTLSSRIEKYCVISGISTTKNRNDLTSKSRSPLKLCFSNNFKENDEKILDSHISTILNSNYALNSSSSTTSIRRHFNTNNIPTEEKIAKDMNNHKFKARAITKGLFNNNACNNLSNSYSKICKKQNDLETFEMVLQKTRIEKQGIDKNEKEIKKQNKINLIKQNKIGRMNKENLNTINRNLNGNMLIEN